MESIYTDKELRRMSREAFADTGRRVRLIGYSIRVGKGRTLLVAQGELGGRKVFANVEL